MLYTWIFNTLLVLHVHFSKLIIGALSLYGVLIYLKTIIAIFLFNFCDISVYRIC